MNSVLPLSSLRMSWASTPPRRIATWNPARSAWETDQMSLFCEHSQLYSGIFPKWITVSEGVLYEPVISEPRTAGSESFSWLPTPQARDFKDGGGRLGRVKQSTGKPYREDELDLPEVVQLLSTPNARDWKNEPGRNYNAGSLPREVKDLFAEQSSLPILGTETRKCTAEAQYWDKYEPAVRRWESILGRAAPAATQLSPRGNPRLNPAFSEWMLGLPEGWVTEVPGLSRKEQLHAIGNGCMPQQVAAALRLLLGTATIQ